MILRKDDFTQEAIDFGLWECLSGGNEMVDEVSVETKEYYDYNGNPVEEIDVL